MYNFRHTEWTPNKNIRSSLKSCMRNFLTKISTSENWLMRWNSVKLIAACRMIAHNKFNPTKAKLLSLSTQ